MRLHPLRLLRLTARALGREAVAAARGRRGGRARRSSPVNGVRLGLVVLLSVGMLAGCAGGPHRGSAPRTRSSVPAAPSGESVADLTWISATHGWALASRRPCHAAVCTDVLTTTDGGSSWRVVGHLAAAVLPCPAGCTATTVPAMVTHLRFANAADGYAFDPDFFVTTDGGVTWTHPSGPSVGALEVADGDVLRLAFDHTGCPGPCNPVVQEAAIGATDWATVPAPIPAVTDAMALVRQGTDAYAAFFANPAGGASVEQTTLLVSNNGGASWTARADPCGFVDGDEIDTVAVAAGPNGVAAVLCAPRLGTGPDAIRVSTDGGASFGTAMALPQPGLGRFDQLALTSRDTLVAGIRNPGVEASDYALFCSFDGGVSWRQCAGPGPAAATSEDPIDGFLGYETATVGRWIGDPTELWATTDGRDWTLVHRFAPR